MQPIIAAYVTEHFDFLAMKLAPNQGVDSMRPVRVSTPGAAPILPLRMVAAGTGATVGITLWVVAEGRYEPQNFPQFTIKADDLTWDWTMSSSDFKELRAARELASLNRAWEVETSIDLPKVSIVSQITQPFNPGYDAGIDYVGTDAGDAGPGEAPSQIRQDDLDTLFAGMNAASVRVTRLRSDLAHAALDADLVLQASADQSQVPLLRNVVKEKNEPTCPIYQGCAVVGQGPRSQAEASAAASSGTGGESFSCSATPVRRGGSAALVAALGLVAAVLIRQRRRGK